MRKYILLFIGLILFASCEKEDVPSGPKLCPDAYYYYYGDSKISLKHALNEVGIVFKQSDLSGESIKSLLEKHPFISIDHLSNDSHYPHILALIKEDCNCIDYKNYLKELNRDNEISFATPVFYSSENTYNTRLILLSEVVTMHNEALISESEFIHYAETLNLELIESANSKQYFNVKKIITGFEALKTANQIYESGKVHFSEPNFISDFKLF